MSFALVNGACIGVYFTNGGTNSSSQSWTLNVNSTGAKSITAYSSCIAGWKHDHASSLNYTYSTTGFFVYMNSKYYTSMSYVYGDYSD